MSIQLKPIAASVAIAVTALTFTSTGAQAGQTVPVYSPEGTHYANFNIQFPGESDERYNGEFLIQPADRFLSDAELGGLQLGFSYFWDVLKGDFNGKVPVEILITPLSDKSDNAFAASPTLGLSTELAKAWQEGVAVNGNAAVVGIELPVYNEHWYVDKLPVLPNLGLQSDLPGTMLHELFHAFGLTANISATGPEEYYFDQDEATDYTLQLHDLSHRSLKELMDVSADGTVDLEVLSGGDMVTADSNTFQLYPYMRYSGMYFSGKHVDEILAGALIKPASELSFDLSRYQELIGGLPGLPINGMEPDGDGGLSFEGSHIELQNSLMSHQSYRNWCVLMEAELALLQDLGFDFDRKRFYGSSIYDDNLTLTNDRGYWARREDGSHWLYGVASDQTWGIGLHIYGSENIVRQTADLLANGAYGIGARVEGVGNKLTIGSGTQIEANGYAGKGLLFSWGKNHHLTIKDGASVTAEGEGGIAVAFDFGSNELGDWYGYYGSYISTRYDSDAEDFVSSDFIVPELQGELISRFTVSGALKGSTASIYISPNAYVKDIVIEPGATIEGDIISLWNPEQTIYGTQLSGYDGDSPLITTLSFGAENSQSASETIEFNDRIVGQKSILMKVSDAALKFGGEAHVLGVSVESGASLEGGNFKLSRNESVETSGLFENHGEVISTANHLVTIEGDYFQDSDASLVLTVNDGQFVPMSVNGSAQIEDGAVIVATPAGGWHADGLLSIDPSSAFVKASAINDTETEIRWIESDLIPSSPTLTFEDTENGLSVQRKENAYSRFVTGDAKEVAEIFDASAANLSQDNTQSLFARMDWSDTGGTMIQEAAQALSGDGVVDGMTAAVSLERFAEESLAFRLSFAQADGDYAWGRPFGGTLSALQIGKSRLDVAGIAGGWVKKSGSSMTGLSVAALDADGSSANAEELKARGLWISGFIRGNWETIDSAFTEASVRLGYVNADEKRSVQFSDFSDTTDADIDRWSIGAAIKTGLDLKVSDNIHLEPFAQLAVFLIHSPSYKEKSHDIAALNIKDTQLRSLEARLGLTLEAATFTPTPAFWQLQALYGRELLSRAGDIEASFAASI